MRIKELKKLMVMGICALAIGGTVIPATQVQAAELTAVETSWDEEEAVSSKARNRVKPGAFKSIDREEATVFNRVKPGAFK